MLQPPKKYAKLLRFLLVGGINTAIDIGGLLALVIYWNMPKEAANIISTGIAFCFSFFANRSFTFHSTDDKRIRQFILFTLVTLFGLWVIQTGIICLLSPLLMSLGFTSNTALIVAKIIATIATLVWNYALYSRVVFQTPTNSSD